jgi:RNA polymerase sigma-70 factor (ECF subfamily)
MSSSSLPSDQELIQRIYESDVKAFEILFKRYYKELCYFSVKYVNNMAISEEIVSGMMSGLWEKRRQLDIKQSFKGYLYISIKNASLNYLKSQYARQQFLSEGEIPAVQAADHSSDSIEYQQLEEIIKNGIEALPPRCRIIFTLSRQAGMSYEEISSELGLSKKTVKAQMGIALHKMRLYIGKNWDSLLFVILPLCD